MAKKRKKKGKAINIAIIILNLLIIAVIVLMVMFVYNHLNKPEESNNQTVDEFPEETTAEVTTTLETTTSTSISITKRTTETEVVDEIAGITDSEGEAVVSETSETETTTSPISSSIKYDDEFYAEDLFIGDSISTGFSGYGYLPAANVFAQVGLNPQSVLSKEVDGNTIAAKIAAMQPKRVYIMLGSNGIAFLDGSYMCEELKLLIDVIESNSPDSKIVILSIPPVTLAHEQKGQETMEQINAYNAELEQLAANGGYTFIDICTLLKDDSGYLSSDYAEADGMHFLGSAYITVLNYIESSINAES